MRTVFQRNNLDKNFCTELIRLLDLYSETFKINTELRRVRFLAQVVHETYINPNGTVRVRENLNYYREPLKIGDTHNLLEVPYSIFIIGGMAHWHRTHMYKLCSTPAITNRINQGLPKKMKQARLNTALRIKKYLIT